MSVLENQKEGQVRPVNVIHLDELDFQADCFGDHFANNYAHLSQLMGAKKLGFHVEELPPQKFSCPLHFHHAEEEFFYIIKGKSLLRQAETICEVSQGDFLWFGLGPAYAHQFYNHTDEVMLFLALSNQAEMEVCEYPDSQKTLVGTKCSSGKKRSQIFFARDQQEYWAGEEDPRRFWPKEFF